MKKVDTCILVGSFKDDLGRDDLKKLFEKPFDFEKIKNKSRRFIFLHSDDDPRCPLEQAKYLSKKLGGKLVIKKGQKHFSVGTGGVRFRKLPVILDLLEQKYAE